MSLLDYISQPITKQATQTSTPPVLTRPEPFENTKTGIALNTLSGIPQATGDIFTKIQKTIKDVIFPARGFEETIEKAVPTFKETALALPKVAAEFVIGISDLIPKGEFANLRTEADTALEGKYQIEQKFRQFAKAETAGQAKAMRFVDIVTALPAGILEVTAKGAKAIAGTSKLDEIKNILKLETPRATEGQLEVLSRLLSPVNVEDDVQRVINRFNFAAQEAEKQSRLGKPITVYHGGGGAKDLQKTFAILSPEQKLKFPSSGGGYIGLSATDDLNYARQIAKTMTGDESNVATLTLNPDAKVINIGDVHTDELTANDLTELSKNFDIVKSNQENEFRLLTENAVVKEVSPEKVAPVPTLASIKSLSEKVKVLKGKTRETIRQEVGELEQSIQYLEDSLGHMPGGKLKSFISKKEGEFIQPSQPRPAGTSGSVAQEKERLRLEKSNEKLFRAAESAFQETPLADQYDNPDVIKKAIEDWQDAIKQIKEVRTQIKTLKQERAILSKGKAAGAIGKKELLAGETKKRQTLRAKKDEEMRRIVGQARDRKSQIKAIQDALNLTGAELNSIIQNKNIATMNTQEFDDLLKEVYGRGQQIVEQSEARTQLKATIWEKEYRKIENLQKALGYPSIDKMTTPELRELDELLQHFEQGDEFLSQRKLELIDRTDLKGVRTMREARARMAQKIGASVEELKGIGVDEFDRFRWDTALAERNAFYKFLVEGTQASFFEGDARFLSMERWVNEHMPAARVGQGIAGKIAPIDEKIFNYLESVDKDVLAKGMTPEQLEVAEYMRERFAEALAYEYEMKVLKSSRYEDSYITHIRRGFFEALREGETKKAFTELFDQYKQDEAVLNILDQKTNEILPLEKFFKFALQRTGGIVPTKNVARAFLEYMRVFERKRALDKIIPEIMAYVDILTPEALTPKGLYKDDRLASFVKEYLNTKKGRRSKLFVQPGGKAEFVLRSVKALTNVLDLAINIPLQVGSQGGIQAGLYTVMGAKQYTTGIYRLGTIRGRSFVKKFENYTSRTPWSQLLDASKGLPEKIYGSMFSLFRDAVVRGNKIHLLGSLTEAEWKSGKITPERLAALRTEAGRWLPIEEGKSILGSTTEGGLATQYKTWAIPPMRTTIKNLTALIRMAKAKENPFKAREFWELFRVAQITAVVSLVAYAVGNDSEKKEKDRTFSEKLINKTLRDSMSMISAIDPKTYTSVPRTLTFMTDLMLGLSDLVRLEEYKKSGKDFQKGDLRGAVKLQRTLTPAIIKGGFSGESQKGSLPKLPKLPPLPASKKLSPLALPRLPKLPQLAQ